MPLSRNKITRHHAGPPAFHFLFPQNHQRPAKLRLAAIVENSSKERYRIYANNPTFPDRQGQMARLASAQIRPDRSEASFTRLKGSTVSGAAPSRGERVWIP
jgi:hypothetical protein